MRVDLHTHSNRSDGTDTPASVVEAAHAAGVDVLALTDHDTAAGWDEAESTARRLSVGFVPGMEVSCRFQGCGVHLLAYLPDPQEPRLAEELRRVLEGRRQRLPATLARLSELGVELTEHDVRAVSGRATALGRPHVADALVARGVVGSREEAFDTLLSVGRPAYVRRYGADLHQAIGLVRGAGGAPVLAHPWARGTDRVLSASVIAELAGLGLVGIEVDHQNHTPAARDKLRALAAELDLVATGSSDYHGEGKRRHELGCNLTDAAQLRELLDRAATIAAESGRTPPRAFLP